MPWLKLKDGTVAHVKLGGRGAKLTTKDFEALRELAEAGRAKADEIEATEKEEGQKS